MPAVIDFEPEIQFEPEQVDFEPEPEEEKKKPFILQSAAQMDAADAKVANLAGLREFHEKIGSKPAYEPTLEKPDPKDSVAERARKAAFNTGKNIASSFTSPEMIAATVMAPGAGKLASGAFSGQMLSSIPDAWKAVQEADKTPAWSQERMEAGLNLLTLGIFTKATLGHFVKGGKVPARSELPKVEEKPNVEARSETPTAPETPIQFEEILAEPPVSPQRVETAISSQESGLPSQPNPSTQPPESASPIIPVQLRPIAAAADLHFNGPQADGKLQFTWKRPGGGGDTFVIEPDVAPEVLEAKIRQVQEQQQGTPDMHAEFQEILRKKAEREAAQAKADTEAEIAVPDEPQKTGVANRVLDEETIAEKIGAIESGEGLSWQEMVDLGREKLNRGANPTEIANRLKRNGRISHTDFAVIRAERERLAVESNQAAQRVTDNPSDSALRQALTDARKIETDWIRNVVQPAKTATSNIFRGMQGEAPIDATTFEGMRRAVLDQAGREPTRYESDALRGKTVRVKKAMDAEAASRARTAKEVDQAFPKTRTPTLEELRIEISKMAEELTPCKL